MTSYIIPTFKNDKSLFTCIETLIKHNNEISTAFEIIVVDNFKDNTYISCLEKLILNQHVKIIKNPILGAHHSRRLGLYNAQGDIIVFVDDDNYITRDYIEYILDSFHHSKDKNLFIGCASQEFHILDWNDLRFHPHSFACGSLVDTSFKQNIPVYWGAGMCMSKKLADQAFHLDLIVDGRMDKKKYIMSGEDHEISLRVHFLGAQCKYFNRIGLIHDFNIERLNQEYYSKIQIGFVYAAWILKLYYLRNSNNKLFRNKMFGFLYLAFFGSLYYFRHPFKVESNLIFKDVLRYSKFSIRYDLVSKFV